MMKHANKKQNLAEQYLTQKQLSVLDILCIVAMIVGGIWAMFVFFYVGAWLILIGVFGWIFSKSAKIKDSEFDEFLEDFIRQQEISTDKKLVLRAYDLRTSPIVVGKDKQARSNTFVLSVFDFQKQSCHLDVYEFHLREQTAIHREYSLSLGECYETEVLPSAIPAKQVCCFKAEGVESFPVDARSADLDVILCKLKGEKA